MSNLRKICIPNTHLTKLKKVRFAPDYLRINFKGHHNYLTNILKQLNDTNTPYYEDGDIVYTKLKLSMGDCLIANISFNGKPFPLFLYNEFDEKTKAICNTHGRIDFYGSLFRLKDFGYDYNIQKLVKGLSNQSTISLSRYDYCADLFFSGDIPIPSPKKSFINGIDTGTKIQPFYNTVRGKKIYISWGAGTKDSLTNYLRVYNKIADTKSKQKYGLYADYLQRGSVHRYEVQFANRMCAGVSREKAEALLGATFTKTLFQNSGIDSTFCKFPKYEISRNQLEPNNKHTIIATKQLIGRSATLTRAGHNPFILLALGLPDRLSSFQTKQLIDSFIERHKH